jgi:hypothetical protein
MAKGQGAFTFELKGAKELQEAFALYPKLSAKHMRSAALEAGKFIYKQEGLKKYPRPGYIPQFPHGFKSEKQRRYVMMLVSQGKVPYKQGGGSSEKYGEQWYAQSYGQVGAIVGNRASYAKWLTSNAYQSEYMAKRGWRKLSEVARDSMKDVKEIFDAWTDKLLKSCGFH